MRQYSTKMIGEQLQEAKIESQVALKSLKLHVWVRQVIGTTKSDKVKEHYEKDSEGELEDLDKGTG